MKEINIFNIKVHPYQKSEFLEIIASNLKQGKKIIQNGINAASINELSNNRALTSAYKNTDLLNIDGMAMVWALRFLGYKVPERVACPDLAEDVLKLAEKEHYRIFLLGADEKSLEMSVNHLAKNYPGLIIAGYRNGYYTSEEELTIVKMINKAEPDILFLGMPSPRKELFVEKYRDELLIKYSFGVGGYFDILSGKTKRAPLWMQKRGLEWLYRFMQEPRRMWYRYTIGNFKFVLSVLKAKFKK